MSGLSCVAEIRKALVKSGVTSCCPWSKEWELSLLSAASGRERHSLPCCLLYSPEIKAGRVQSDSAMEKRKLLKGGSPPVRERGASQ